MPPEKYIRIVYMYLKQGKWKQKTVDIKEERLIEYEKKYRILSKEEIWG